MKKYIVSVLAFVMASFVMVPSWAQAHKGVYISGDIGANFASGLEFEGASNDSYSDCDAYLNPGVSRNTGDRCNIPERFIPDWLADFDRGQGILAGAAVGYSFAAQNPNSPLGGFRVEMEYFYRQSKYDQVGRFGCTGGANSATCTKVRQGEFAHESGPQEYLGSITSHNLFGNVYYDFANTSRLTPYIGIGGGFGVTDVEYGSNWTRTLNQNTLSQGFSYNDYGKLYPGGTRQEYNDYISNLAGSSSVAQTTLSDTLWGFQVLFGADYAMTETMSLGLKGRYVNFGSFSGGMLWNPLRSHAPYIQRNANGDPSGPLIEGSMSTSDIQFFGISLNMKYHF